MKNILAAALIVAMGSVSMAASANAVPAASLAGIGEQAGSATEQVGFRHRHKFHRKRFFFHGGYGGFYWKKFCYYKPWHWKCKYYDFGY